MKRLMPKPAERVSLDAAFLALGLILSYAESLIPVSALIPLPGIKPGFASLAVMCAVMYTGLPDAFLVMLARVFLSSALFGSPVSFIYSLSGGILSFASLVLSKKLLEKEKISFVGMSIFSAASHNIGQIIAACFLLGNSSLIYYLAFLLLSSVITGSVTGLLMYYITKVLKLKKCAKSE